MDSSMANITKWLYLQRFLIVGMMISLCRFSTQSTVIIRRFSYFSVPNAIIHSVMGKCSIRMFLPVLFAIHFIIFSTFGFCSVFSLIVFITIGLAICCKFLFSTISSMYGFYSINSTYFAFVVSSQWTILAFMKLGKRFRLLATRTFSCYNWLRHDCFSIKQLCLEPASGHIPVSGLFYYNRIGGYVY